MVTAGHDGRTASYVSVVAPNVVRGALKAFACAFPLMRKNLVPADRGQASYRHAACIVRDIGRLAGIPCPEPAEGLSLNSPQRAWRGSGVISPALSALAERTPTAVRSSSKRPFVADGAGPRVRVGVTHASSVAAPVARG